MKIFIIGSTAFYDKIPPIKEYLEKEGIELIMPNSYDNPNIEEEAKLQGQEAHTELERKLFKMSEDNIKSVDAVLCINFEKHGIRNYIGRATFIEIYEAFKNNKDIYLYNDIPEGSLNDELTAFGSVPLRQDLSLIKKKTLN